MDFVVSDAAFRRLWSRCGLGDTPVVLQLMPTAFTEQEQDAERDRADAELAQQGLVHRGRADADVEALLRILHRRSSPPTRGCCSTARCERWPAAGPARAPSRCAPKAGCGCALRPSGLAWAVVGLLPEHPAGPGDPGSLPAKTLMLPRSAQERTRIVSKPS